MIMWSLLKISYYKLYKKIFIKNYHLTVRGTTIQNYKHWTILKMADLISTWDGIFSNNSIQSNFKHLSFFKFFNFIDGYFIIILIN